MLTPPGGMLCRDASSCSGLPVLADADTGFGEVEAIARVVSEYSRAGAAGFHIEDQVSNNDCEEDKRGPRTTGSSSQARV